MDRMIFTYLLINILMFSNVNNYRITIGVIKIKVRFKLV